MGYNYIMRKSRVFLIIIGVVIALIFLKDILVKFTLEEVMRSVTGLKISARDIEIGVIKPYVKVQDLIILNTDNFPDRVMFDVPFIYVEFDPAAIFRKNVHIRKMSFNLRLLNVLKNKDGKLNLDSLNITKKGQDLRPLKDRFRPGSNIKIDELHLVAGRVIYKDYGQYPGPRTTEFHIDIDEEFKDIKDPYLLGKLILSRALRKTNVPQLAGFDMSFIDRSLGGIVTKGANVISETKEIVGNMPATIAEKTGDVLNGTKEAIAGALKVSSEKE